MAEQIFDKKRAEYIKDRSTVYSRFNKSGDVYAQIIDNFSQLSATHVEYQKLPDKPCEYSSVEYSKCTDEEKRAFTNDQLTTLECLVTDKITEKRGSVWGWDYIYALMTNPSYKGVDKKARKVIFPTSSTNRPIGEPSFGMWNGFQIIDLDIKDADLADRMKPVIFKRLCKTPWFLGVYKSSSGKGLHVWTKVVPCATNMTDRKIEFQVNFRHKYSAVYVSIMAEADKLGVTKEDVLTFMDMAMAKPQQGSFIAYDGDAMMSTNFQNVSITIDVDRAYKEGVSAVETVGHPDLNAVFAKLRWFSDESFSEKTDISKDDVEVGERDLKKARGKKHYKHAQRWQLANTLVALFGEDKGLDIMIGICDETPVKELRGDCHTAAIHSKPVSKWAISELNKYHGFNIKYSDEEEERQNEETRVVATGKVDDNRPFWEVADTNGVELTIKHNQYLSDIKDEIVSNLGQFTLLEAGAGYGKTEMIKALKEKTLLVLPFTSTIKAKVETSHITKDWLYYYGNKRPTFEELLGPNSMSMTVDKFSKLNLMELNEADFKYIVIDESHLLFISSYRDVMSPTIQRLANCTAKVILMTGTPTGEMLFFPSIRHITVKKEDWRDKVFTVHLCPTKYEQLVELCKDMTQDIIDGKKILFPTNKGRGYYDQMIGLVQQFLIGRGYNKKLHTFYYKKSSYGDESMTAINEEKTIGINDIVFCSNYLSVGVDICDKYTFSIYFDETWIPQNVEQFANRIRNNDLIVHMYLPKRNSDGYEINYKYVEPLNLSLAEDSIVYARDLVETCNDNIKRNGEEAYYNPIISNIIKSDKYVKYDETECEYYIDETEYKLKLFEERFTEWGKQLPVLIDKMRYYGYRIDWVNVTQEIPRDRVDDIEAYIKACRVKKYNEQTQKVMEFLNHINENNLDIYKELLKGSYDIFKDDKYKEDREQNDLYVEDIEILEKQVPIVLGFSRYYDCDTIRSIYGYCIDVKSGRLNMSKLKRILRFAKIENSRRKKRLDFPVHKFVKEAQEFATANSVTTSKEIQQWLANFAAKYGNSVPDVVVDDTAYLKKLYALMEDLWKVVVVQYPPKGGKIKIMPFTLLWTGKNSLENVYSNDEIKTFFQELMDDMNDGSSSDFEEDDIDGKDLPHTSKKRLSDIKDDIPNIIHKEYDYQSYSELDGSNERFLRKQTNTRAEIVKSITENTEEEEKKAEQLNIFGEGNTEVPF